MIKINLALKKQANFNSKTSSLTGVLPTSKGLQMDVGDLAVLPWKKFLAAALAIYVFNWVADDEKQKQLAVLQVQVDSVTTEIKKVQSDLSRVTVLEQAKAELDREELVVRQKIQILEALLAERQIPTQVLLGISHMIPETVWLSAFQFGRASVRINAMSINFSAVSDFVRVLEDSPFFSEMKLQGTQTSKDARGIEITTFDLVGKRKVLASGNGTN